METTSARRRFKLRIWWLALGYFAFYAPYAAFIKVTTTGLWPGVPGPVSGFRLLPGVVISTAVLLPLIVSLAGWWEHAGHRRVLGLSVPFPRPLVLLSGFGTAIIIGTTTLIFTFPGVSIVFALVLMRGGVLIMGPIVDGLFKRRVRWFSWAAFGITVLAILVAITDVSNYRVSLVTAMIIVAYLSGYLLRLPSLTRLAKAEDRIITRSYFVEEIVVAMFFLVAIPAIFALIGQGELMMELRHGFAGFFTSSTTLPALIIGAFYACLYCFGTHIYLDCRENTYCIPLNRCSSLLAGFFASYGLTLFFGLKPPSPAQLESAGILVIALLFLSPLHHFDRVLAKLRKALARPRPESAGLAPQAVLASSSEAFINSPLPPRLFLFVCSGNTCRSPMAAAIAKSEIAVRLGVPFESVDRAHIKAMSAGVTPSIGEPMTDEAKEALRRLGFHPNGHRARSVNAELANQAEKIFCMTDSHRAAIAMRFPSAAKKASCLDPDGDIEDPIGCGIESYIRCATRIQSLVRTRLDELHLT